MSIDGEQDRDLAALSVSIVVRLGQTDDPVQWTVEHQR
jgi:hypothetical protein